MDNKSITLAIAAGLVVFVIGGGLGVFYQKQTDAPQMEKLAEMQSAINSLSLKTIISITAVGKVISVDGNKIVLTSTKDNLEVIMNNSALIYSSINPASSPTQVALKDIKTGDNVSISIKLLANGQIEGQSVMILPGFSAPAK